jgi:hypothetical protein
MADKENKAATHGNFVNQYKASLAHANQATQRLHNFRASSSNCQAKVNGHIISAKAQTLLFEKEFQKHQKKSRETKDSHANKPHTRHFKSLSNISSNPSSLRSRDNSPKQAPLKTNQNIVN